MPIIVLPLTRERVSLVHIPVVIVPPKEPIAVPNPVQAAPILAAKPATNEPEKPPDLIAERIADHAQSRNKIEEDDAIKAAEKAIADKSANRQKKPLPTLKGKAGRVHSDEELDDIMRTMLRDGKAPYGKARQQYNYRIHVRLADVANELIQQGVPLHGNFKGKDFWNKWSLATGTPLQASFYRKFA